MQNRTKNKPKTLNQYSVNAQFKFLPFVDKRISETETLIGMLEKERDYIAAAEKTADTMDNSSAVYSLTTKLNELKVQKSLLERLDHARRRITVHHTYGTCAETGVLISKERLMSTPHTTVSILGQKIREKKKK